MCVKNNSGYVSVAILPTTLLYLDYRMAKHDSFASAESNSMTTQNALSDFHLDSSCDPCSFVCFEVLRPSQPNGVMSSAVSLPNHTFTGQA